MPTLLAVLFAVSVFSPEPLNNPPTDVDPYWQQLERVNALYDGTLAEGWDDAMRVPLQTLPTLAASNPYRGMGNGTSEVEQWRPLVAGQLPPEQLENALCVIRAESGGNSQAKNRNSNARGLFQIMTSVWADEFGWSYSDFYVPELNVYAAARIWERSGWVPWSPRTRRICGL